MGKTHLFPSSSSSSSVHKVKMVVVVGFLLFVVWCEAAYETAVELPAIFVFGDSTVDVGTNSYLAQSKAIANFPYYGIDFPHSRPTGRFSNGLNGADFLAKIIGYESSPRPFLSFGSPLSSYLRNHGFRGASFASAGSGILDLTAFSLRAVSLSKQITQFALLQQNLTAVRGSAATQQMLRKSLFFISIGSNDIFKYVNESRSTITKPASEFISFLMKNYLYHIQELYILGARKFGILSVPPIGCCPAIRATNDRGGCNEPMNDLAIAFHSALQTLLQHLSSELPDLNYSLGNAYLMTMNVINNPQPFHFQNVDTACCGFGRFNAEQGCNATANLCLNRKEYVFWDEFHPTQAAARLAANILFTGPPLFVSPINFAQLVRLD